MYQDMPQVFCYTWGMSKQTVSEISPEVEPVTYDMRGVIAGIKRTFPVGISIFAYGLIFGVLSGQAGLRPFEALLMSSLVYAGSAQFAVLGMWIAPLPAASIIITTLIINLRHVLMGAALYPWFSQLSPLKRYLTAYLMTDESWALTMGEYMNGRRNAGFLLGSGIVAFTAWNGSTIAGQLLGGVVQDPAKYGLDFAFTAVFIALLLGLWRGKGDLLPWGVAALVAIVVSQALPGKWYILAGGFAGSLMGAWTYGRKS